MKTVQMTLDDDLVREVDQIVKKLSINRSAFARKALREAVARFQEKQLELQHRKGYERYPVTSDEFSGWESEQLWGDQ